MEHPGLSLGWCPAEADVGDVQASWYFRTLLVVMLCPEA